MGKESKEFNQWRPHPWHGLKAGKNPPYEMTAYIEITPLDVVKYEIDKETGYTMVDRPQASSSCPPTLYGFIPRTYCGDETAKLTPGATCGDGDALDICVISERPIDRADIIMNVKVLGGLQILDGGEADDKIIAVLAKDTVWKDAKSLDDVPPALIDRIHHYFGTYKMGREFTSVIEILGTYGPEQAAKVIEASMADYEADWGSRS